VPKAIAFDGGVLVRVAGNFGVGFAVSSFNKDSNAAVTGTVPHPFFFNTPRPLSGTATGTERTELATHIQAAYIITSGRIDVAVSGGPSIFNVKQGLVSDVTYSDSYPFDSVTFTSATTTSVSVTKLGFNVGADIGVRLSKNFGVGGLIRFSRASLAFPLAGSATDVSSDAGGLNAGGGVRFFF
jgi:hypothetical protein